MRETLYIRLGVVDPDTPVAFCIARADAVASFVVEHAPLRALASQAAHRRVVVLVPSADLRLTSASIPARQGAKALQAAPFFLEDQLADDIDDLHFALGARQADGVWPVAVVGRERMNAWQSLLSDSGLRADALIPDALSLSVPDAQHFSVLIDGSQVIVRTDASGGFVCQREDLELCLGIADPDKVRTLRLIVPRDQAFDPSTLSWPHELSHGFAEPLEALLQNLRGSQPINLLQGNYSIQQDWLRYAGPWRVAAGLAGIAFVLAAANHGVQAYRLGAELEAQDAANRQRYQQIFPAETRIVDLSAQLDQQLTRLNGGQSGPAFVSLMSVLAEAVDAVKGLTTQSVQFREGALYVSLSSDSLQALEKLKAWFETSRPARMEVQSANAGSEGVQIRIKLSPA
ncbi:type II secretion system protein GspL [Sinimarinibacterium sp. CAU 1509]|uniref:type II secretion system protein GspL n=1 Tax=Sinimarinibacterium sp. CAU 1509 TaxID=2562283 RepID=UPI00146D6695|nr:type II secretion system protein GspL [Sinimarinibacterium sp. CAU 1509]